MDSLKKIRAPIRAAITRNGDLLETELENVPLDRARIEWLYAILEEKGSELETADHNIQEALIQDEVSTEEYSKECEEIDAFKEKLILYRLLVNTIFKEQSPSVCADGMSVTSSKKKFRLPKLEVQKFGGDLKDWLCFWSPFRKIHEDTEIDAEDKFQYLLQAITTGTRARELIESYPPTAENYPKVVESLQQRFGREELLVEVYVRELLRLVLHNATNPREKVQVTKLYDQLESHIRALDTLGVTSEKYAAMLYPLVESCLPEEVLRVWQRHSQNAGVLVEAGADQSKNRLTKVLDFLRTEVEGEERIRLARAGFGFTSKKEKACKDKEGFEDIPTAAGLFNGENHQGNQSSCCIFCGKKHPSQECFQAQKMSLPEKRAHIQKKRSCFTCLRIGHMSKDCKQAVKCIICSQKHYPVMCSELPRKKDSQPAVNTEGMTKPNLAMSNMSHTPEVVLKTLMVTVTVGDKSRQVRVLVDDGSQRSYILKSLAEGMNLNATGNEAMVHALFGGVKSRPVNHLRYEVPVGKLDGTYQCTLKMLDQQTICAAIPKVPRGPWLGDLKKRKIWLSDVGSDCPEVEILIGADIIGSLMTGQIRRLKSGPVAVETRLGWTLMGEVPKYVRKDTAALVVTSLVNSEASITNLWCLEAMGIRDPVEVSTRAELEAAAKDHFLKTIRVNAEGRYEVHLPWIEGHPKLETNRVLAERRLMATTNRLKVERRLQDYAEVFQEWLMSGIIEKVPEDEQGSVEHYLPHRAVFKENSSTTKVRPVFDASAHEKHLPSLNDCLEKGPNLIEEILILLIRLREKRIGVVADIAKAFLQLSVAQRDRDFLRFLWWDGPQMNHIITLRHKRVVFGVSSSPFLLAAVLEYHLDHAPPDLKKIAESLRKCFYVDNCISCVNNEAELKCFIEDAQKLLLLGKFDLRGWEHTETVPVSGSGDEVQVLGLLWDKFDDTLRCDLKPVHNHATQVTKRKILSVAHQIFDPIGFLCPVTLHPKILLQSTWESKVGWDIELPSTITEKFLKWSSELQELSEIRIPRWLTADSSDKKHWSLHTFSDASKLAFAACTFMRAETDRGIVVQLVLAKSRVAPLKSVTIPRLELLSCLMGTRLATVVKNSLCIENVPCYHWTDSSTALSWIQKEDQWATFVGNRVQEIRSSTTAAQWNHVPGHMNPADLPSIGCSSRNLVESRWWEGPPWLKLSPDAWPKLVPDVDVDAVNLERRKTVTSLLASTVGWSTVCKYFDDLSSYSKIVRRVAWYSRFISWLKKKPCLGNLTVGEFEAAEWSLLKTVQMETFKDNAEFAKGTVVVQDGYGLFRVKSKLTMSDEPTDFKFPILLPGNHPITALLILEHHLRNSHAGIQVMMSSLREKFWITRARRSIRTIVRKCVRCRRFESKNFETDPAPLPKDRIREAAVFEVVGVDLAGPLYLKGGSKAWVVIYTCAVYRAVHFELVTSLSTERFMMSLQRFVAKRGRPSVVYSDNGTNFVGTENVFTKVDWNRVEINSSVLRIQWRFNPPSAAWWGGWWERIVRMLKTHLRRVLGKASLDYEELSTTLADIKAVINSRPLTYISEDMEDLSPISPSLFLKEGRGDGVPEVDVADKQSLNKRWQHRLKLREQLRKRFRAEYLSQLVQQAGPISKLCRAVRVGEVVLVGSDNKKRLDWPLAKVLEVIPGRDGKCRVVRLKTAVGEYVRPVQRIYPLEIASVEDVNIEEVPVAEKEVYGNPPDAAKKSNMEEQTKLFKTRCGRVVKAPVKFSTTHVSLFSHCV